MITVLVAAAALAQDQATVARLSQAACGPDDIQFDVKRDTTHHPTATPEAGKALVYVIEEQKAPSPFGAGATIRFGMDGAWMGANRANSYFFFAVEPGDHHLCALWRPGALIGGGRDVALANFTAEAGKVYYFRARTMAGRVPTTLDFDPVNSDQGQLLVASSAFSDFVVRK